MLAYVQEIAKEISARLEELPFPNVAALRGRLVDLREEADRLDPREFSPDARVAFIHARRDLRAFARAKQSEWESHVGFLEAYARDIDELAGEVQSGGESAQRALDDRVSVRERLLASFADVAEVCEELARLIDSYAGTSKAPSRSLALVQNADLRKIVERDYRELTQILFPEGAWKSVVIAAGSILEAILHDRLTRDAATISAAMSASKAPKKKRRAARVPKDITRDTPADEWKLKDLIEVAAELGYLPPERANTIDQVLRDYRNFVHPKKELKAKHACSDPEGMGALAALNGVIDNLK